MLLSLFCCCLAIFAQPSSGMKVQLRVMNYNVRQLPIILGVFNRWDQGPRLKRLPDAIRKLRSPGYGHFPHVMFFNELMTSDSYWKIHDDLKTTFPNQTPVAGASCKSNEWNSVKGACDRFSRRSGVMGVTSLEIVEKHAFVFKNCDKHTWDCKANKGAVYMKVKKEGYFFHLVGTHLQADEAGDEVTAQAVRVKQMKEMRDWLGEFNIPKSEPVIIVGDLNVEWGYPSAKLIEPLLYEFDFADDAGFGSFSAKTNLLAMADAYSNGYDLNYDRTLDYIMAYKDHKLPIQPAWMEIMQLQSDEFWYWKYLNREFDIPGVGKVSKNGYYNDVTDHWPVAATYLFEF